MITGKPFLKAGVTMAECYNHSRVKSHKSRSTICS